MRCATERSSWRAFAVDRYLIRLPDWQRCRGALAGLAGSARASQIRGGGMIKATASPHMDRGTADDRQRLRRAVAFIIDAAPFAAGAWIITVPVFLLAGALAIEARSGTAFFAPGVAGDPALGLLAPHPLVALAYAAWVALEAAALVGWRRSIGKRLTGLRVVMLDGSPPSWRRALAREALRGALAGGLVLGGALGPAWLRVDAGAFYAGGGPSSAGLNALALGATLFLPALALGALVTVDAVVVLAGSGGVGRSVADRVVGTLVLRQPTSP
jgi:uncharacterized RDD family membrane protein YckC